MSINDASIINPLYSLAMRGGSAEDIMNWVESNTKYSRTQISRTLKHAGMHDLADYIINEVDVSVGDTVRSRSTARVGKITGIHSDGCTVDVKWATGGVQAMSKEYLVKLSNKEDTNHYKKYTTENDPYSGMDKANMYTRPVDPMHKK